MEADCGSDHEPLDAKFRVKLKKVRKTTRPFRYDLNQIPYDYTVEVRNRFKGQFNMTVIHVYVPTSNSEEAEVERFYEDLQTF